LRITALIESNARRARNGIKLALDVDPPRVGQTTKHLVWSRGRCELWRYCHDRVSLSPPLLFVYSLVSRSYIIDLQPGNSFVEHLQDAGLDVFLLDWAPADERHAEERLEDYVDDYIPEAIARTCEAAGSDSVNLLGYCSSGLLTLLHAARHQDAPVRSLTNIATPVDFERWGLLKALMAGDRLDVNAVIDDTGNLPSAAIRHSFRLLQPTAELKRYIALLEHLGNDDYLTVYRAITRWQMDHVPFPGAAARQMRQIVRDNALVAGRLRLGGEPVSLRDVRTPLLTVVAARDQIIPKETATPLPELVGSAESDLLVLEGGHIGLVVGRTATRKTLPPIIGFMRARSDANTIQR
jgi:polyhydroxyalkanoate synthase subunit PhaC